MSSKPSVTRHPVRLSYDADSDRLMVCEFGSVPEERMDDQRVDVGERLRFFLRQRGGAVIGFGVDGLHAIDPEGHEPDLWGAPRFRVPVLGLRRASVGEIVLSARASLADRSTADVVAKTRAADLLAACRYEDAEVAFRDALDAGSHSARLGLASCLCGQGRYREGYDHARIFTELAPRNSWAWAWLGRVCVELGERTEAQSALRRAVLLEREGSYRTPARELLRSFAGSGSGF